MTHKTPNNTTKMREEDILAGIITHLEYLSYNGLETMEPSWVRSVLLTAGVPRQSLMLWVLSQLVPTEAAEISTAPPHIHTQRILQCLSCMGICRSGDSEVIQGTAPAAAQLQFWQRCLDSISHVRRFSTSVKDQESESHSSSILLDQLADSPYLQPILKDGGTTVIPGDLREKYRMWCRYGQYIPVTDLLQDNHDQLNKQLEKYSAMEEHWKVQQTSTEQNELQANVCQGISDLSKQHELFQGVYSLYIAPWTTSNTQLELPNTGPLVHESNVKLTKLTQVLKRTEEASQRCEELGEQEKAVTRHSNHSSAITSTLHSLISQQSLAKSVQ
nr:uncharacterized protein LOC128702126 isoform X1 [Cherax quadricarinatus]